MFGYITINQKELTREQFARFHAMYCGLCRTLRLRFGSLGRLGLSYDMTCLAVLLNALYEPEENIGSERCALHPARSHPYVTSPAFDYAADLNLALAYHKCRDNWQDDHSAAGRLGMAITEKQYQSVRERLPGQCSAIESWLARQSEIEKNNVRDIDLCANLTGEALGALYAWRDDVWADDLRALGAAIGRFVYFMDAYEDLPKDIRKNHFNPLKELSRQSNYEALCRDALTMFIAEGAAAFERLPILRDAEILRNILYSGVWSRYGILQKKRKEKTP